MIEYTITDTRELTPDGIYNICRRLLFMEKRKCKLANPLNTDEYTWLISHDILCVLYGEVNAGKLHKIMGIQVLANKGRTRSIILRRTNENVGLWDVLLNNKELSYCRNDVEITKKAYNSFFDAKNTATIGIRKVIFNDPATIIFWNDGTKTVVKADGEAFDPEKGMAMAISKKMLGNEGNYYDVFKKWLPKDETSSSDVSSDILTVKQLAEITGQSIKRIQRECRQGLITATKVNGQWRIPITSLEQQPV